MTNGPFIFEDFVIIATLKSKENELVFEIKKREETYFSNSINNLHKILPPDTFK